MKNTLLSIFLGFLCVSFTLDSTETNQVKGSVSQEVKGSRSQGVKDSASVYSEAYSLYIASELDAAGLSFKAFMYAWKGYQRLIVQGKLENTRYLTICDLSQSSKNKRFYIVDLAENKLITNTYVAHGRNSGGEFATRFSNKHESLQSSLGFFVTGNTYIGAHGLSLRLIGVDGRFNNNALARTIVIHGADYVDENRVREGGYMGRSWGCPALPKNESTSIINTIKEGACLFIYNPQQHYIAGSTLLNG